MHSEILNKEELLQLSLFAIAHTSDAEDDPNSDIRELAERYLVYYIVAENDGIDTDGIVEETGKIIADFILGRLAKRGMLDVDMSGNEITYSVKEDYELDGDNG